MQGLDARNGTARLSAKPRSRSSKARTHLLLGTEFGRTIGGVRYGRVDCKARISICSDKNQTRGAQRGSLLLSFSTTVTINLAAASISVHSSTSM